MSRAVQLSKIVEGETPEEAAIRAISWARLP